MIPSVDRFHQWIGTCSERMICLTEDALPGLATGQGIFFARLREVLLHAGHSHPGPRGGLRGGHAGAGRGDSHPAGATRSERGGDLPRVQKRPGGCIPKLVRQSGFHVYRSGRSVRRPCERQTARDDGTAVTRRTVERHSTVRLPEGLCLPNP